MAEEKDKLRKLEDPIARKKRRMEEALARKRSRSEGSEDTTGASSDTMTSASSDTTGASSDTTSAEPPAATPTSTASPATPTATPATPTATPATPTATPGQAAAAEPTILAKCPACANEARVPAKFVGQLVKCAGCGAPLRLETTGAVLAPQPVAPGTPTPAAAAGETTGIPLPLVAGAGGLLLLFLLFLAFRGGESEGPAPSPTQVAVSPTTVASPSPSTTPTPTPEPSPTPEVSPTQPPTPSPIPTLITPTPKPESTPLPKVCTLQAQVATVTSAGLTLPLASHRMLVIDAPDTVLSELPKHVLAYEAAVRAGLSRVRGLDWSSSAEEFDAQATRRLRGLRADINEIVRSFRSLLGRHMRREITTDGRGQFTVELDPGSYLLVSDEWFVSGGERHTVFAELTVVAGERRYVVPAGAIDRVQVLVARPATGD